MHTRLLLLLALVGSLLAVIPAHAKTTHKAKHHPMNSIQRSGMVLVDDRSNGGHVTLYPGEELSVQLDPPDLSRYEWCRLDDGDDLLTRLPVMLTIHDDDHGNIRPGQNDPDHSPGDPVYFFRVSQTARAKQTELLRFVYVPKGGPNVTLIKTWQIHITIAARPVKR